MKISFITTIYNEEKTINDLIKSLIMQTQLPDEIIIVDGGSTDKTREILKKISTNQSLIKIFIKTGNRSVGRNEAVRRASGDIIACSDSGNILDKNWLKNITEPFTKNNTVDVVAGYYNGKGKTIFQKCLIPFVLVMPDKVNPGNFLPATRSIAFKKTIWNKAGMFNEKLSHNEDYAFAIKLKKINANIFFAKDAIVNWIPGNSFRQSFIMFFRFALGDIEAGIIRKKVLILFARYIIIVFLIAFSFLNKSVLGAQLILILLILYIFWSISKNYKYINIKRAAVILPVLQFTADFAVLFGSLYGFFILIKKKTLQLV